MANILDLVKWILIAQLFYAFGITMLVYALPASSLTYVELFQQPSTTYSYEKLASATESGATGQLTLPLIDQTTLIYHSGTILIDLVLNFISAIPQMLTLLIGAFLIFFSVDSLVAANIKLFFMMLIQMIYIIGMISFILGLRSQGGIIT